MKVNKTIGLFGGTFDPVHYGHLISAQSVLEERNLEKIILMPCHISPHKINRKSASHKDRLEMLKLAINNDQRFGISDFELMREGVSYTIDSLRILKQEYDNIELIIGLDNLLVFEDWKEPDEIFNLANVLILNRKEGLEIKKQNKYFDRAIFLETPIIEISSSEIRRRIALNLPITFLTSPEVEQYIKKNGLYK